MVPRVGFEPTTSRLGGARSILLSYRGNVMGNGRCGAGTPGMHEGVRSAPGARGSGVMLRHSPRRRHPRGRARGAGMLGFAAAMRRKIISSPPGIT